MRALAVLVGLVAILVISHTARAVDDDLERTWRHALVNLPGENGTVRGWIEDMDTRLRQGAGRFPTVIHLHGCAGLNQASYTIAKTLVAHGYAVIMPDSFAREHKPQSCDPRTLRHSMHRGVIGWRRAEANRAIRGARGLDWVDPDNLFLWGFSEGAIAAATVTGEPVNARVVEGWTCHAGWSEYKGLQAPEGEPVLALLGANDPWFTASYHRGDCGEFMAGRQGSRSVVFEAPQFLAKKHFLSWHEDIQMQVLEFLADNRRD